MKKNVKSKLLNKTEINRVLRRISHEILEKNEGVENLAIIGIKTRGAYLAHRIANIINETENKQVAVGELDITLYRDDLTGITAYPLVRSTDISFDISDKNIILVDDVLYTGRTVRAALNALIDLGRSASISLAVLIDRGNRQLPIHPDFTGKLVPTAKKERVTVHLKEIDQIEEVLIVE